MFDMLFEELITLQEKKLLACAEKIVFPITLEDLLQPNDYPELENHPYFRYEEGVLKGLHTAQQAIKAYER